MTCSELQKVGEGDATGPAAVGQAAGLPAAVPAGHTGCGAEPGALAKAGLVLLEDRGEGGG